MTQQAIIIALFLIASSYMGWRLWKSFSNSGDAGCAKGCGCAVDKDKPANIRSETQLNNNINTGSRS